MDGKQFNTALLEANGISPWFAGIIMKEIEELRAENARLKAALDAAQANVQRMREAIETVLRDDESAPGGWGPDVTCVSILRNALANTTPPPAVVSDASQDTIIECAKLLPSQEP